MAIRTRKSSQGETGWQWTGSFSACGGSLLGMDTGPFRFCGSLAARDGMALSLARFVSASGMLRRGDVCILGAATTRPWSAPFKLLKDVDFTKARRCASRSFPKRAAQAHEVFCSNPAGNSVAECRSRTNAARRQMSWGVRSRAAPRMPGAPSLTEAELPAD